jgi:hypothetical protein
MLNVHAERAVGDLCDSLAKERLWSGKVAALKFYIFSFVKYEIITAHSCAIESHFPSHMFALSLALNLYSKIVLFSLTMHC